MSYETPTGQINDSVYYNAVTTNTSTESKVIQFEANLAVPFLEKPSDYNLNVSRFIIPGQNIPMFLFHANTYLFTMTYQTFTASQYVVYDPRSTDITNNPVYEMQHWIDMLNTALAYVYFTLNALVTLPTVSPPYFIYNTTTEMISLIALKTYASTDPDPVKLFANTSLYQKLGGFPVIETGIATKEFQFYITDTYNNTYATTSFEMAQQAPSIDSLIDFTSLVFTTNIPIRNEYLGTDITFPILTDYNPGDVSLKTLNNDIVYNSIFPYRQTQLLSDTPLQSFNINVWWSDPTGKLYPMTMPTNKSANLKLMFLKKK